MSGKTLTFDRAAGLEDGHLRHKLLLSTCAFPIRFQNILRDQVTLNRIVAVSDMGLRPKLRTQAVHLGQRTKRIVSVTMKAGRAPVAMCSKKVTGNDQEL
jgi:hypothetical protein